MQAASCISCILLCTQLQPLSPCPVLRTHLQVKPVENVVAVVEGKRRDLCPDGSIAYCTRVPCFHANAWCCLSPYAEAPVVKVSATMTPEERTAAIRAEALRDAKFAAGEIARTRGESLAPPRIHQA